MFRELLFTAACLLGFARAACGVDASVLFADGERAFAAGDYGEALRLFMAAREAGSTGPSSYYNIGVSQYLLRDYGAAEDTFTALAAEFPAMRELAEYNRGLALRADGNLDEARVAFARARTSDDEKIASLADAQLSELGAPLRADAGSWSAYISGGLGYDDNVALLDDLLLPTTQASSPLAELLAVVRAAAPRCDGLLRSIPRRGRARSNRPSRRFDDGPVVRVLAARGGADGRAQHRRWRWFRGAARGRRAITARPRFRLHARSTGGIL
jgi:tetratricopeptide (TPR) repeat protein